MSESGTPSSPTEPAEPAAARTRWVKQLGASLGFDLVGVASAGRFAHADAFFGWLQAGRAGTMQYMQRFGEQRCDPTKLLDNVRSVIAVACSYHGEGDAGGTGRVARYALGEDYHEVMKPRLHTLADAIRQRFPGEQTRCCVDTSPILEREAAAKAGLGWIGKNTCLINREWGSWVVLGEVITTLPLEFDSASPDFCGTCTRCLDACPTGALTAPQELDARKCISYLTLEHRETLVGQERQQIGDWLVGCDICQECCPWNGRARVSGHEEFRSRFEGGRIDPAAVVNWSEQEYRQVTRHSAVRRMKLPMLQDRARAILENSRAGR